MAKRVEVVLAAEDEASKTVEDVASNFSKLGDIAETLKGVAADLSATVGKLNEFFDRASVGAKQQAEAIKQAGAAVNEASRGYTRMGAEVNDVAKQAQEAGQEFKQNATQAEEMSHAAKEVGDSFKASGDEIKKAEQRLAEAKQQVSSLTTEMTGAKTNINSLKGDISQLEAELLKAKSTTGTTKEEIKQLSTSLGQAKAGLKEAQAAVKPLENDLSKAKNEARLAGENLKALKGDAGTLTGALNSLKGEVADNTKALKEHGENSSKAGEAIKGLAEKIKGMAPESEKTSGAAQGLVDKMGGLGKAGPVAAAAIAAVAAVAVDMGKKALEGALEIEKAGKLMVAQLGATKQEAEALKKVSGDVFKTGITADINEVNTALVKTKQAFRDVKDQAQLKDLTEQALVVSKTFNVDVNEVLRTASTLTKNFKINGQEAFDIMTTGFQQTGDMSGDLLDTLNEYSPQFAQAGTSANQFLGTLITGSQAGAFNLDKIGDSVKEFRIRFAEGSDDFKNGLAAIGLNYGQLKAQVDSGSISIAQANEQIAQKLTQVASKTDEARIAAQLYGTQSEDLTTAILPALAQTTKGFDGVTGSTKKAEDAQKGFNQAMQGLINTGAAEFANGLDIAFSGIGDTMSAIGPDVQQMAHDLGVLVGGAIKTIIEKGKELYDSVKPVFDDIGNTLKDILPPGQDVADLFKGALGVALDAVTFQFKVWAVGIDIVLHAFDELKKFVTPVIDTIRAGIKTIIDGFASVPNPWQDQAKAAQALWEQNEKLNQSLKDGGGALGSWGEEAGKASAGFGKLNADAQKAGQDVKAVATSVGIDWKGAATEITTSSQAASAGFGSLSAGANQAANDLATASAGGGSQWATNIGQLPASTQTAMTGVAGAVQSGTQAAVASAQSGAAGISSAMSGELTKGLGDIKSVAAEIAPAIAKEIQANTSAVTGAMDGVKAAVIDGSKQIIDTISQTSRTGSDIMGRGFQEVRDQLVGLRNDLQQLFSGAAKDAAQAGVQAGQAFSSNLAANVTLPSIGGGVLANIAPNSGVTNAGAANAAQANGAASFDFVKEYIQNRGKTPSTEKGPGRNQIGLDSGGGGSIGNFLQGRGAYYNPDSGKPVNINVNVGGQKFGKIVADTQTGQLKSTMGVGGFK